jgi:Ca2+-binding EF-hand superfamily protein
MKKLSLITIALFLPALGLQAEEDNLSLFTQLDADQNGLLSKEETKRVDNIAAMFDVLDANGDGQLNLSEFKALAKN